jgi:hypothetical protein
VTVTGVLKRRGVLGGGMCPCGDKTSISNRTSRLTDVGIYAAKDGMVQRTCKIIQHKIILKRRRVTTETAREGLRHRTRS